MLFLFSYEDGTQGLVEVSQISYDPFDMYLTLHGFRTIRFDCMKLRYDQICNDLYNYGKSDIRDLSFYYD